MAIRPFVRVALKSGNDTTARHGMGASMSAKADQLKILKFLHGRFAGHETRYCTIPTIKRKTGVDGSNQYVLALADDLESAGMVITRQMYQVSGGKLFQITAAGFDAVEQGQMPPSADSAAWTGRFDLSEYQKEKLRQILREMRLVVEHAKLSNSRTANALALIESAEKLIETPDPLWPEVMRLLRSPVLAGVGTVAGLLLSFVQILMAAASS